MIPDPDLHGTDHGYPVDHPLAGARRQRCEWCLARTEVVWCVTMENKRMPIEPTPNPDGNTEVVAHPGRPPLAVVHGSRSGMLDEWVPYMPHHATCPRDAIPTDPGRPATNQPEQP